MDSPYSNLQSQKFWKTGVAEQTLETINELYKKRFEITTGAKIATAGSCFAQHIAVHLRKHGFSVLDLEPAPPALPDKIAKQYGFNLYSARYGNIYTVRHLLQLIKEAYGKFRPKNAVWQKGDRYYDAMRPNVEPNGVESLDELTILRKNHLAKVRAIVEQSDVFVFTMGLTEAWIDRRSGTTFPTAPGTIAGTFDPKIFAFKNFTFNEILKDFLEFRKFIRRRNKNIRFILTVSPVPLTATASEHHVLAATTYSKSVLRAVAGELYDTFDDVDYFPSYELIASPISKGTFYKDNLRDVTDRGVATAMRLFLKEHGVNLEDSKQEEPKEISKNEEENIEDVICEDVLIEAFSK